MDRVGAVVLRMVLSPSPGNEKDSVCFLGVAVVRDAPGREDEDGVNATWLRSSESKRDIRDKDRGGRGGDPDLKSWGGED